MQQLDPKKFLNFIKSKKINFFTGVPDSLLKNLISELEKTQNKNYITAANEGLAVSLATGYNLLTKKIPCVFMQNSGLGNAINPLSSITHREVYSIPMLLIIGWRGGPGFKDEPQHLVTGKFTLKILKLLKIRYLVIDENNINYKKIRNLINFSKSRSEPVALVIKKGTFKKSSQKPIKVKTNHKILRKDAIKILLKSFGTSSKIIATTGYTSRELNQLRSDYKINKGKDFYLVGGMGHTASVSLGVALNTNKRVICLDGDGSILMHLGSLTTIGNFNCKNFTHIMFNNKTHESVGGQKILSDKINYKKLVLSVGYKKYYRFNDIKDLQKKIKKILLEKGPVFLDILTKEGSLKILSRPKNLKKVKKLFNK